MQITEKAIVAALVEKIHIVENDVELSEFVQNLLAQSSAKYTRLGFVNAHAFNMICQQPDFADDLSACEYVLRDGSGMKIFYRMMGRAPGLNLNGTDLIPKILDASVGRAVVLMGTEEPYLSDAARILTERGVRVTGVIDGFQPDEAYTSFLASNDASVVVLAMGMPRQERIARLIAEADATPRLVLCGGAILDFIGGKVTRAPKIFRDLGLEWVYRLALEPKRLFNRYIIGNIVFLWRAYRYSRAVSDQVGPV